MRQFFPTAEHTIDETEQWLRTVEAALGEHLPAFEKVPGMRMEDEEQPNVVQRGRRPPGSGALECSAKKTGDKAEEHECKEVDFLT